MKQNLIFLNIVFGILPTIIFCCTVTNNTMTPAMRASIVARHNELRNKVASGGESGQPKASDMLEVVWDTELEGLMQSWVNTCPTGHNPNRVTTNYQAGIGENLYWSVGSVFDPVPGINLWYGEVSQFSSSNIDTYTFSTTTGHYSQVVWHNSNKIGCGFAVYGSTAAFGCNYVKPGNYGGQKVYTRGEPCASCPNNCSSTYTSLCKTDASTTSNNTTNNNSTTNNPTKTFDPNNPFEQFKKNSIKLMSSIIFLLVSSIILN